MPHPPTVGARGWGVVKQRCSPRAHRFGVERGPDFAPLDLGRWAVSGVGGCGLIFGPSQDVLLAGMFGRKARATPVETPPQVPTRTPSGSDRVLDTLVRLVRVFGQYAFDTERASGDEVKEECDRLIRSVALGQDDAEDAEGPRSLMPLEARDYGGLVRYLEGHRRHEQEYVERGFKNLRHTVQEFAQCLTVAVAEDRDSDTRIEQQIAILLTAVAARDTERIHAEALSIAHSVRGAIARRRDREAEQVSLLGREVRELKKELEIARTKATLDPLTQLYNRAAFDEEIDKVARLGLLLGNEPCLLMVDLDRFKAVNDGHGHPVGDLVLRTAADNLVRHFLRKEDFVTRYGGEEFAIIVRDSSVEKVAQRAERARSVLEHLAIETPTGTLQVTQSTGIAGFLVGEPVKDWITRADRALYRAKQAGRNRVELA